MTGVLVRRGVAILLPCAVLLVFWLAVVAPVMAFSEGYEDQRDSLLLRIAADERAVASGPAWRAELARLQAAAGHDAGARGEASQALAAAGLQNDIQAILAQDGGQVMSVQVLPAADVGGYETVSMQFSLVLPVAALPDFLRRVEMHVPYMLVRAASFQAPDAMAAPAGADAGAVVNLSCTILAYRRI
jgi:hypothetical protein